MRNLKPMFLIIIIATIVASCNTNTNNSKNKLQSDTIKSEVNDSVEIQVSNSDTSITKSNVNTTITNKKEESPKLLIYNFYATNRCVSCVAIENATKKTLETYFAPELKNGIIKLSSLCIDDEANAKLAEKYQAFGSALFVTRVYKGKETSTDLTGDGFKYAKNKQEKFIEILKNKITEYLK